MKNKIFLRSSCATLVLTPLLACSPEFDQPVENNNFHSGTADFSNFVAVGDSLTAGYADSALYLEGQKNSYPSILATQFSKVGGGDFIQPLMSDNLGGLLFQGSPLPGFLNRLVFNADTKSAEPIDGSPATDISSTLTGAYNNMGVPGAKSFHLTANTYGNPAGLNSDPATANPYFVRFASSSGTTIIADAVAQQPSFFALWIGNNDVLSYATGGGIGIDRLGNFDPAAYDDNDITDPTVFANVYSDLLNALRASGGHGVLINIPDISSIPFFTTVPFNPIPMDQESADLANNAYDQTYNAGLQTILDAGGISDEELQKRTIHFSAGQNAAVIEDEYLTDLSASGLPSYRQATANDRLLLTISSKIGKPVGDGIWGISAALEDADVLVSQEIDLINTARLAYNASIKNLADGNEKIIHIDSAILLKEMKTGINYGTGLITTSYATGDGFSLDGVHLTARGYAVLSNEIIDVINTKFAANIQHVNPGAYPSISFK